MAISITVSPVGDTSTEIDSTTRSIRAVNATITASTDDISETIDFVDAVLVGNAEPGLTITSGAPSVSIVGTYVDPFVDIFTFVSKGSSDKIETPTNVISIQNVPANRDLFNLNQDLNQITTKIFTIEVTTNLTTAQFTVTQDITNELEPIRLFMDTYYD